MSAPDKPTRREKQLFRHWRDTVLAKPVRALTADAISIYPANVLYNGDVQIPLPPVMQGKGRPTAVTMVDGSAFQRHRYDGTDYLQNFDVDTADPRQAIVMWLGQSALGRHHGEPMNDFNLAKLRERVEELQTALLQEYGLSPMDLRTRICVPREAFATETGHRACAAIVLAMPADKAALLQNEIYDKLLHAQATAGMDRTAPEGLLTQRLQVAPKTVHKIQPRQTLKLLPAPTAVHHPGLRSIMKDAVGDIVVHKLDRDNQIYPFLPTLYGDVTPEAVPVKVSGVDDSSTFTHVISFWLNSKDLRTAFDDMKSLGGDEAESAAEHIFKRMEPLGEYLRDTHGTLAEFAVNSLNLDNPLVVTIVIGSGNEQRAMLNEMQEFLQSMRPPARDHGHGGQAPHSR